MDHFLAMNVDQPPSDTDQLENHAAVSKITTTGLSVRNLQV